MGFGRNQNIECYYLWYKYSMYHNDFPENLIKGRIAENIFELMVRESGKFDIYPLGYEHTTPILCQYRDHPNQQHKDIINKVLDNYDSSPDFLLTNHDKSEVYLVEVKYRSQYNQDEVLKIAEEINNRWNPVYLFLATPDKFYYDLCRRVIEKRGNIDPLQERIIPADRQKFYVDLLMRFEPPPQPNH